MAAHPLAPVRGSDRLVVATSQTCATKPRRPPPCRSRPRASAAPLSVVRPFALASNESSDTFVLPFASQINHALSTPTHNRPFEAEVIFCVQGAMEPILPNPSQPRDTFSNLLINRSRLRRDNRWIQNRPFS